MSRRLVIQSRHDNGWEFVFRKLKDRPIEMVSRHKKHGQLGNWQAARNFCLKALISYDALCKHFSEHNTERQDLCLTKGV